MSYKLNDISSNLHLYYTFNNLQFSLAFHFLIISSLTPFRHTQNKHSHKKRKDSLEKQALLTIFLYELEISVVAVQGIHQNSENGF